MRPLLCYNWQEWNWFHWLDWLVYPVSGPLTLQICIMISVMPTIVWRFPRAAAIWFSSYFPCQGKNAGPMLWLLHSEVWAAGSAFLAEVDREMGKKWGENLAMKSGYEMLWRCMDQILNTPVLCYKDVWCMAMYGSNFGWWLCLFGIRYKYIKGYQGYDTRPTLVSKGGGLIPVQ